MKAIIITLLYSIYSIGLSQIPTITWQHCYGTSSETDRNYAIEETNNGFLLGMEIGINISNFHGLTDIWIIKSDSNGNIVWEKCYGGSNYDTPYKIIKLNDNIFYIFGATKSSDGDIQSLQHGESDLWVIQINEQGGLLWEKCYGSPGPDEFRDMILTPDGGFLLLSRIHASGGDVSQYYGSWDNWLCKCDSFGNIEWEKTLGNEWLDGGMSMIINSMGNIVMIGAAAHYGGIIDCSVDDGYGDVWLIELDMQGNIIWQNCYGGSSYDIGTDIIEIDDGYVFSAGSFSNDGDVTGHHGPGDIPPGGWSDYWIVKINYSGEIIWQKSVGGYSEDEPIYITQTNEDEIISIGITCSGDGDVTGNHNMPGSYGYTDVWMIKLSVDGDLLWQKCFGGWGNDRFEGPHTIIKKSDNNYIIASNTNYKSGNDDIQCDLHGNYNFDAWVFEIKDCSQYMPAIPETPLGTDTVCTVYGEPSIFTIEPATFAWDYEWAIQPDTAGTIGGDSLQATVNWNPDYEGTVAMTVRSHNDCGYSELSQPKYVQVNNCLRIGESSESRIRVYPNPAKEFVEFHFKALKHEVEGEIIILNIFGQEVGRKALSPSKATIDVSQLPNGLYFYSVEKGNNSYQGKLIIQR